MLTANSRRYQFFPTAACAVACLVGCALEWKALDGKEEAKEEP